MDPKIEKLLNATYHEQRSPEWLALRETMLTASDAATACGANPYESPESLYIKKVGGRKFSGNAATERGTVLEPIARDLYDARHNKKSHEIGLVQHPLYPWLGGSADGITECGRLIEIKCPLTRKIEPTVPKHYIAQIQLNMEILDLEECDFIQYRPGEGDSPEEFVVTNVKRDREWFSKNLDKMKAFWDGVIEGRKSGFICEVIDEDPIELKDPICEVIDESNRGLGGGYDREAAQEHQVCLVQEEAPPTEVQGMLQPVLLELHSDGDSCLPQPSCTQEGTPSQFGIEISQGGCT
jgi:putative phage-type endonuclease